MVSLITGKNGKGGVKDENTIYDKIINERVHG